MGIPHQDCASRMREKQVKRRILNSGVLNKRQEAAVSLSSSCGYQVSVYADETVLCNKSLNHNNKFVQKAAYLLKSRINKRLCKHANRTLEARGGT